MNTLESRKRTYKIHGMSGTPLYHAWSHMIQRTTNEKNVNYPDYGGRSITVCDSWLKFEGFMKDMGPTHKKGLSLDRIDNSKGYSPKNCRWATSAEQSRNRRSVRQITFRGETMNLIDWAARTGISRKMIHQRIYKLRWSIKDALTLPLDQRNRPTRRTDSLSTNKN